MSTYEEPASLIVGIDLSPSGVQPLSTMPALAMGVATWLTPRPDSKVLARRLLTFVAVAVLVALIDPT
jgi:hypothetical protein